MAERPHVLVLMADQMQADRLGFVDGISHTPNLDSLAREGVHFPRAYTCQGQCVPSRAAFQTGLYAHECGVMVIYGFYDHQNRLGPQHVTLGHAFQQAGYRTAYFGKAHFGVPIEQLGYEEGFVADRKAVPPEVTERLGIDYVPPNSLRNQYWAYDETLRFLDTYEDDGRPLFLTFSTNMPHPPFFMEPRFEHLFEREALPLPRSFYEETFAGKPPFVREHAENGGHGVRDEAAAREMLHFYLTMIAAVDDQFGQIIERFKQRGWWDRTVVLMTADHGDMMAAHKLQLKGTLPYEELYRIPLIVRLPTGSEPVNRVVAEPVSSERFAGTLMRAAGIEIPESFHHGDLYDAMLRSGPPPDDAHAFIEHYAAYWGIHPFYGVVTSRYKYVRYYGPDAAEEMYDLEADPEELTNLAEDPAVAAEKSRLAKLAEDEWRRTGGRSFDYYESDAFRQNLHNAWPDFAPSWEEV